LINFILVSPIVETIFIFILFFGGAVVLAGVSCIAKQVGGGGISKGESGGSTVAPLNFVVFLFFYFLFHTLTMDVMWMDGEMTIIGRNPKVRRGGWLLLIFQ
jgi:hypothetical protein